MGGSLPQYFDHWSREMQPGNLMYILEIRWKLSRCHPGKFDPNSLWWQCSYPRLQWSKCLNCPCRAAEKTVNSRVHYGQRLSNRRFAWTMCTKSFLDFITHNTVEDFPGDSPLALNIIIAARRWAHAHIDRYTGMEDQPIDQLLNGRTCTWLNDTM